MEVHPGAKWTEFEDYLAVLFLENDVEFSGKIYFYSFLWNCLQQNIFLANFFFFFSSNLFIDQIRPVCLSSKAPVFSDNTLYRLYRNNTKLTQPTGFNTKKYTIVRNEKCQSYKIPFTNAVFCAKSNEEIGSNGDPFMHAINEDGMYPIYQIALDAYHMNDNPTVFVNIFPYIGWIDDTINGNIEKTKNDVIFPVLRAKEK